MCSNDAQNPYFSNRSEWLNITQSMNSIQCQFIFCLYNLSELLRAARFEIAEYLKVTGQYTRMALV